MDINGEEKSAAGFGVGPIDALFNVIAEMTGRQPELEQYAINAITGGTDAQGEVTVRLQEKGVASVGRGTHPDIFVASAKAYVDALNNLVRREEEGTRVHCQHD